MDDAFAGMSLGSGQQRKLIIGIDFGTTYSGIAWAETRRPEQQTVVNNWPSSLESKEGKIMDKVPTELRYTAEGKEWGFQIPALEDRHRLFKLGLVGGRLVDPGHETSPESLATDYLTALRDHLMYTLEQKLGTSILRTIPIEYCLTVPAIWSEVAKEKTLEAASRAGLNGLGKILLVSEPEAAAIYTLNSLDTHDLKIDDSFVLCDAGGGTVDLISYTITQLQPKLNIREASPGSGGMCGSTYLNRRFARFLTTKIGQEEGWDAELLAEAMERFDLVIKKQYSDLSSYTIPVPGLANNEGLGIKRGRLLITRAEMRAVFEPVVSQVISLVEQQIVSSSKKIRAVFLVGGFGENSYLKERLRAALGTSIEVIQPPNAWTAVTRGAVLMGLGHTNEDLAAVGVTSRAARKHYGIRLHVKFDPERHDASKKFFDEVDQTDRVAEMQWFIKRGDPVEERKTKRILFQQNFLAEIGPPTETSMDVMCDEISTIAPVHPNENCRTLVTLRADLRSISSEDMESTLTKNADGKWYYLIKGDVEAEYLSASTKYMLLCLGKRYDTITAEYA
ncbi:actin-like ATPase domain-containing protein [Mollisia scopiformis]|uniref:Actin-like ATPase domain-containing protein n=1 Tax=Mollisia scopiformis TaxID=149040 RepID=A0A194WVG9_MOLSC|nr:actin-like ATPase domain-containing protein [Mollisia scopiformis]KUJ11961.1 actin-like ATPase domain-containing protein [Mollisia scopiformis]